MFRDRRLETKSSQLWNVRSGNYILKMYLISAKSLQVLANKSQRKTKGNNRVSGDLNQNPPKSSQLLNVGSGKLYQEIVSNIPQNLTSFSSYIWPNKRKKVELVHRDRRLIL